jgi:putative holliday junction resolvase
MQNPVTRSSDSSLFTPHSSPSKTGAVLAFDFGLRRVGVACGDLRLRIAHPLETIEARGADSLFSRIAALLAEWRPVRLVVGLPVSMAGEEHELTRRARGFAHGLQERFGLPVELADERLSSAEASLALKEAGIFGRKQRPYLDQVAACRILQSYFDDARTP